MNFRYNTVLLCTGFITDYLVLKIPVDNEQLLTPNFSFKVLNYKVDFSTSNGILKFIS
jgi:hypothetical protein